MTVLIERMFLAMFTSSIVEKKSTIFGQQEKSSE